MNTEHLAPQILLRSWPFPRGAGRIVDRFFSNLQFDKSPVEVKTTDDFTISINPNELIGRHIYLTGEFDRSIVEVLCNFSEPGDVLLDIGANIGYVSACFLKRVRGSSAIAVEPQATVLKLLRSNLTKGATIYPYALADADGEVWFETNQANSGAGRIVSDGGNDRIRIETRSPNTMFPQLEITRLDLVKIDAEGFERTIISACLQHFKQFQPRAILFEDAGRDAKEIASMLDQIGYRTYGIQKSLTALSLVDGPAHDYIAISKTRTIPERATKTYRLNGLT
jgi:FkbM family methyltransferase